MAKTRRFLAILTAAAIGCGGSSSGGKATDGGTNGGDGAVGGDGSTSGADASPPEQPFAQCAGDGAGDGLGGQVVCFAPPDAPPDSDPLALIEHEFVNYMGVDAVHIRLTFDPTFVDNTYGTTAVGWDHHNFKDLVGSDHAEILLLDATGEVTFDLNLDYISKDDSAPCGYSSLGVSGGDGGVVVGDESAVLGWSSSLDLNLNDRGYCDYTENSPATDENCNPNPDAPDWDFRVQYELWVALSAFDPDGFGTAHLDFVHASPAKGGDNTIDVEPEDCPEGTCNDPDGCDNGSGGSCMNDTECSDNEFCYDGSCLPIIQ